MATYTQTNSRKVHVDYGPGALAGLVGGIAMAMVTMLVTGVMGMGVWIMPQMIAGFVLGQQVVMTGGAIVIIVGLMLHMMLSVILGLIYAFIVNAATHELWLTGIVFGIMLWLFNFDVIGSAWPPAGMMLREPIGLAIVAHMVFGVVTAWVASAFLSSGRNSRPANAG